MDAEVADVAQDAERRRPNRQLPQLRPETMLHRRPLPLRPTTIRNCSFTLFRIEDIVPYSVSQIGSADDGYATEISLAVLPDGSGAATATRDQHSDVELTTWNLIPGGMIHQSGQVSADPQADVHIAGMATGTFVTTGEAIQGGHIKSILWEGVSEIGEGSGAVGHSLSIAAFPNRFALLPQNPPPPPKKPTQVAYPEGYLVATAHINANHHLRVTSWFAAVENTYGIDPLAVGDGGETVATSIATRSTTLTGGNVSSADVVTSTISDFQNGAGKLHLSSWRLHVGQMQPVSVEHLHGLASSVQAKEVAIATYPRDPASALVTAVVTPDGNLEVIGWQVHDDGTFTRGLSATSEAASLVSCAWCTGSIVVTAFKDGGGKLKLIYWQFPASASDPQTINQIAEISPGESLPYGGVSVGHWRASQAHANDLGETLVGIIRHTGNARLIRFHLASS